MILTRNLLVALIATVISFSTLYIPQPLLPLLADQFGVSAGDAGLLMTVTMLPLALAPVFYGYFLQAIPARTMLIVALFLLAVNQVCFMFANEFWHLLLLRFIQGLLLPAIFTALMTYCSSMAPEGQVRKTMALYIGTTILGGFLGRFAGGFFADAIDWQMAFVIMGLLQILPLVLVFQIEADADIDFTRLDVKSIARVLRRTSYRYLFLALATLFFVFSGILNLAPFHLQDIDPTITPFMIAMLYLGYLMGTPVSFYSVNIGRHFTSDRAGLFLGLGIHLLGLITMLFVAYQGMVVMMFFLAGGFFLIHSLLSGLANHMAEEHRGVVNGLYVSIYYLSGAMGSWLPGYFYEALGWSGMISIFIAILAVCAWSIGRFDSNCS